MTTVARAQRKKQQSLGGLTLSPGLPLPLGSQILLELAGADLVLLNLLASEALDGFEELGYFVGHFSST
jgi:hypothetical protein